MVRISNELEIIMKDNTEYFFIQCHMSKQCLHWLETNKLICVINHVREVENSCVGGQSSKRILIHLEYRINTIYIIEIYKKRNASKNFTELKSNISN